MKIAIRLSYQVPQFTKSRKLSGYRLEHMVCSNAISEEDFATTCDHSVEKLLELMGVKDGHVARRVAVKFGLTTGSETDLIRYTGVSIAHIEESERIAAIDERWV